MFKANNKNTRTTSCRSGVFIVTFEHISHLFLVFLFLTLNKQILTGCSYIQALLLKKGSLLQERRSGVFIIAFEHIFWNIGYTDFD